MSNWANSNPEKMAEIAALPLSRQNEALRDAVGLSYKQRCEGCGANFDKDFYDCCPVCGAAKRYRKP